MKIEWQIFYQDWQKCRETSQFSAAQQIEKKTRQLLNNRKLRDIDWILEVLAVRDGEFRTDKRAYFILHALGHSQQMPNALFEPMLKAAVYERDPSWNERYVVPCLRCFGRRRVNRRLVNYLRDGSLKEKAGAVKAFYWSFGLPHDGVKNEDVGDLWAEANILMRTEYKTNTDPELQREIETRFASRSERLPDTTNIAGSHTGSNAQLRAQLGLWLYLLYRFPYLFILLAFAILLTVLFLILSWVR